MDYYSGDYTVEIMLYREAEGAKKVLSTFGYSETCGNEII